jgi:hypothetical protein
LLVFLEHPTARLSGANAQACNWFPRNRLFNEMVRSISAKVPTP